MAMTAYLRPNLTFLRCPIHPSAAHPTTARISSVCIRCGRRDNRAPLSKGRTLSIEAIQAVQSLKRAYRTDPESLTNSTGILFRLLKADLVAAFNELLRQDRVEVALKVFAVIRTEFNPDLGLYAELVSGLGKKGMKEEIDGLVAGLEEAGRVELDDKGLVALVRALIGAERAESTVRIYGLMKRSGWGSDLEVDEEGLAKILSRGLRNFGESDLANEIDEKLKKLYTRAM